MCILTPNTEIAIEVYIPCYQLGISKLEKKKENSLRFAELIVCHTHLCQ